MERVTEFEEGPEQSPGFLLWQVSTQWRRLIESTLSDLGLTHPQFVLLANLAWLTHQGDSVTQVDLARHCRTDINMTSQVLRTLEKKGLIKRVYQEGNERSKFPQVTKEGARLIEKAIPLVEQVEPGLLLHPWKRSCENPQKTFPREIKQDFTRSL